MKSFVKLVLRSISKFISIFFELGILGNYFWESLVNVIRSRYLNVNYKGVKYKFSTPNHLSLYRAKTFSTKEPETLDWIDQISAGSVVWDIGANVGLYSVYAAKSRGCDVYAFEPSIFNLELLARNIHLNNLSDKITIVPLPLCEKLSFNTLKMTSENWGGAMSTFGENFGHDGEIIRKIFEYPTIGLSMTEASELLGIPKPDFIKMDVDGIEHLILKGGAEVLDHVRGVLVEINDDFNEQAKQAEMLMIKAGFQLLAKKHADCFDEKNDAASTTYNQIWTK
jgi:FkbM family methyltransferase